MVVGMWHTCLIIPNLFQVNFTSYTHILLVLACLQVIICLAIQVQQCAYYIIDYILFYMHHIKIVTQHMVFRIRQDWTSISFPREVGLGINNDSMKLDLFMHIHGGRLYGIKMIGHVLYLVLMFPYRLNPSTANPILTL